MVSPPPLSLHLFSTGYLISVGNEKEILCFRFERYVVSGLMQSKCGKSKTAHGYTAVCLRPLAAATGNQKTRPKAAHKSKSRALKQCAACLRRLAAV